MSEMPADIRKNADEIMVHILFHDNAEENSEDVVREMISAALMAERLAQKERDAKIAEETVKPIIAGNFGLVHVAEIGRQIATAIRAL